MYEAVNSQNDKLFQDIVDKALAGTIAKGDFVKEILTLENKANTIIRNSLSSFKFSKKEIATSEYFQKFKNCPDGYEENLAYNRRVSKRDVVKEYETKYDLLRKQAQ